MSTSVVPVNRIELHEEEGRPIPTDWALDSDNHKFGLTLKLGN